MTKITRDDRLPDLSKVKPLKVSFPKPPPPQKKGEKGAKA